MKVLALEHGDQNTAAIDPWTAVHLATGLASGLLGFSLLGSLAAAAAYEVAEQAAERTELGRSVFQTNGPESAANVAVDLLVFGAGNWIGQAWNATAEDTTKRFKLSPWTPHDGRP